MKRPFIVEWALNYTVNVLNDTAQILMDRMFS